MTEGQTVRRVTIRCPPGSDVVRLPRELGDRLADHPETFVTYHRDGDLIELSTSDLDTLEHLVTLFAPQAQVTVDEP